MGICIAITQNVRAAVISIFSKFQFTDGGNFSDRPMLAVIKGSKLLKRDSKQHECVEWASPLGLSLTIFPPAQILSLTQLRSGIHSKTNGLWPGMQGQILSNLSSLYTKGMIYSLYSNDPGAKEICK